MKQITAGLLAIASMFVVSCSSDAENDSLKGDYLTDKDWEQVEQAANPGLAFFDAVRASSVWFDQDHSVRLAALNLPDRILNKLTTAQLAECCAKYPFNGDYLACNSTYEDDLGRFIETNIMDRFNGFKALKGRPDYADGLLDAYQSISREVIESRKTDKEQPLTATPLIDRSFLEHVLYYEQYPEVFVGEQGLRLRAIVLSNIESDKGTEYGMSIIGNLSEKLLAKVDKYASK